MLIKSKIMDLTGLGQNIHDWRERKKTIIFTNGCFDIVHRGHLEYLESAKSFGDVLIVGINSDASVRKIKGPKRPIISASDRAYHIASLACVNAVTVFDQADPLELIRQVEPDILVKGADWDPGEIIGADIVLARGGSVKTVKFTEGYSSTEIIKKIYSKET